MKNNHKKVAEYLADGKTPETATEIRQFVKFIAVNNPAVFIKAIHSLEICNLSKTDKIILQLAISGKKIQAIKEHRNVYNTSLMDAKTAVELLIEKHGEY